MNMNITILTSLNLKDPFLRTGIKIPKRCKDLLSRLHCFCSSHYEVKFFPNMFVWRTLYIRSDLFLHLKKERKKEDDFRTSHAPIVQ